MSRAVSLTPSAEQPTPAQPPAVRTRLSLMMFLQYAAWGVWLPYLAKYLEAPPAQGGLGFTGAEIGWILGAAGSAGALTAPFIAGQLADRFFNAERALGGLLIVGGILNFTLFYAHDYWLFLLIAVGYSVTYMPTLALTNSIAFANLANPEKQFPPIRVFGTIGWIVASNAFPLIWLQTNLAFTALPPFISGVEKPDAVALIGDCLRVSGIIGILYGLYSILGLPKTPPKRNNVEPLAFARAFGLLRNPAFLALTVAALPISMIHQVYFFRTAPFLTAIGFDVAHVGPVMSIGQFSEIFFLAVLGFFLTRLGYRWTLILGTLAYAARFALFALGTEETRAMVAAANTLHGLCYGFFFAGAYLFVERVAPPDVRHSAQTVFGMIILGLGPILAGLYNQYALQPFVSGGATNYSGIWWVQSGVAAATLLFLVVAFHPGRLIQPRETQPQ